MKTRHETPGAPSAHAAAAGRGGLLGLLLLGGPAVLASYAWGASGAPAGADSLWGGVPETLRDYYVASMLAAAVGFFPFTWLFAFRTDPARARIAGGRAGYGAILACYALVLLPAAAWLPLTAWMLRAPSPALWWAIRLDLFAVAVGSLGLLLAIATLRPAPGRWLRSAAWIGVLAFCHQTVVLDALVWPAWFPR